MHLGVQVCYGNCGSSFLIFFEFFGKPKTRSSAKHKARKGCVGDLTGVDEVRHRQRESKSGWLEKYSMASGQL